MAIGEIGLFSVAGFERGVLVAHGIAPGIHAANGAAELGETFLRVVVPNECRVTLEAFEVALDERAFYPFANFLHTRFLRYPIANEAAGIAFPKFPVLLHQFLRQAFLVFRDATEIGLSAEGDPVRGAECEFRRRHQHVPVEACVF